MAFSLPPPKVGEVEYQKSLLVAAKADDAEKVLTLFENADPAFSLVGPFYDTEANKSLLHIVVALGSCPLVATCLAAGASPLTVDAQGRSALQLAISLHRVSVLERLFPAVREELAAGSQRPVSSGGKRVAPNAFQFGDRSGFTILHAAAHVGDITIVDEVLSIFPKELLAARDDNGQTSLHVAASRSSAEVVAKLISAGVPVDTIDGFGRLAIDSARKTQKELNVTVLEGGHVP